jgi:hypothetical protein
MLRLTVAAWLAPWWQCRVRVRLTKCASRLTKCHNPVPRSLQTVCGVRRRLLSHTLRGAPATRCSLLARCSLVLMPDEHEALYP